jgi:sec-independent protein translocase protein TatA
VKEVVRVQGSRKKECDLYKLVESGSSKTSAFFISYLINNYKAGWSIALPLTSKIYTMGSIGTTEIILIIVAILILFGGKKIPELMRGFGKGIREFNDAKNNVRKEIEEGATEKDKATTNQ